MWRILSCALILALAALGLPAAQPAQGAAKSVFSVINTLDSGVGSLRWAINQSIANPGADTITFNIPGTDPNCAAGICTIAITSAPLVIYGDNDGVTIDGYTQPGAAYATTTTPAVLKVQLDGSALPVNTTSVGIGINSANNTVRGLAIHSFPSYGILIGKVSGIGAPYTNTVSGNFIGTNISGVTAKANGGGVGLAEGAYSNWIGGDSPAERNIISGNTYEGVTFYGATVSFNVVTANYIGVNAAGTAAIPNGRHGVWVYGGAHHNAVGALNVPNWRNVIAGNGQDNVRLSGDGTIENVVLGNFIGTNAAGSAALGGDNGVYMENQAHNNYIGGNTSGQGNLISGNDQHGIWLTGDSVYITRIQGNWIGLNAAGTGAIPNTLDGIHITNSPANVIGWHEPESRNVISGNGQNGVYISGSTATVNYLYGNYLGTNPSGTAAIPNGRDGVRITNEANDTRVGGDDEGQGNLISGNTLNGLLISGAGTDNNLVAGNLIGLTADGMSPLGNQEYGVKINISAANNIIGGDDMIGGGGVDGFSRNVISGNLYGQVYIMEANANQVIGNYIGTDITGMAGFAVGGIGVTLQNGASNNIVGSCNEFEGNLISGNQGNGVAINSGGANSNSLACNLIGLAIDKETPLGNQNYGIALGQNASHNKVGNYNMIAYNAVHGVLVVSEDSDDNEITQNYIFSNGGEGILLDNGNNNMPAPGISDATLGGGAGHDDTVSGTACASCWVEVFSSLASDGEGQEIVGRVQALADGSFTLTAVTVDYPYVTATAWRSGDGTSPFSAVYTAPFTFMYLPVISR